MSRRAIIVGGGIGGLASAISLRKSGWDVEVLERRPEFSEIGAGLTLWPNALAALDYLGVGAAVRDTALSDFDGGFMTRSGTWLTRLNTDDLKAKYGDVTVLARPDLLALLLGAVPEEVVLRPSTAVSSVRADGTVVTADGDELHADLVVGADGVKSMVRTSVWPQAKSIAYSGFTAWRFNTHVLETPVPDGGWLWGGDLSFGYTPLPGGRAYAYAIGTTPPGGDDTDLSAFKDWPAPIPMLIDNVGETGILRHDIYEVPALKSYVEGKVALVGDAAHAMLPSLGQGACQALEDAVTIGLFGQDLARYDKARRRRTRRVVLESRVIMRAAHFTSRPLVLVRDLSMRAVPRALNIRMLKADWSWRPPIRPPR